MEASTIKESARYIPRLQANSYSDGYPSLGAHLTSALSPAAHHGQTLFHADHRRECIALVFDDVPLRSAGGLANVEDVLPGQFIISEQRVRFRFGKRFDVNARHAPRKFLDVKHRVAPRADAIARIELNDHVLLCATKKRVPGNLALQRLELDAVIMIADAHTVRFDLVGALAENIRGLLPVLARLAIFLGQTGHDQKLVPENLVELDRLGQVVAQQRLQSDMRAAAFQIGDVAGRSQRFG